MLFWVKRIIKNSLVKFPIWDDSNINNALLLSVYINKYGYIWIIYMKIFKIQCITCGIFF